MNQPFMLLVCIGVIVGMWMERFEIVITSLHRTHLPSAWGNYHGSFFDWSTLLGTVGFFFFGMLLIVRLVPVIPMSEMRAMLLKRQS